MFGEAHACCTSADSPAVFVNITTKMPMPLPDSALQSRIKQILKSFGCDMKLQTYGNIGSNYRKCVENQINKTLES